MNVADYSKALGVYSKLISADSSNKYYNYEAGMSYYFSGSERSKALPFMERCLRHSGDDTIRESYFFMAECLHLLGRYDEAVTFYSRYEYSVKKYGTTLSSGDQEKLMLEIGQKKGWCKTGKSVQFPSEKVFAFGTAAPVPVKIEPLDSTVNSRFDDYSSLLSPGDSLIYFTTRRNNGKKARVDYLDARYYEDIFVASKNGKSWNKALPINGEVNTIKRHEATNFLTKNGKRLYLYKGVKSGTMYTSDNIGGTWSKPVKLSGADMNSKNWESSLSFCISEDNVIYVVSDRPGGMGGRDIYYSQKEANGEWGTLVNMGQAINSAYDEDGPFITADGNTLYFASNNTNSMGGFDIFRSEKKDGKWQSPMNLGPHINSTADDIYFHFANNSEEAFFSSSRLHGAFTDLDIFHIVSDCKKLDAVEVIADTKDLKEIEVSFSLMDHGVPDHQTVKAEGSPGKFLTTLPTGRNYRMNIQFQWGKMHKDFFLPRECFTKPYVFRINMENVKNEGNNTYSGDVKVKNEYNGTDDSFAMKYTDKPIIIPPVSYFVIVPVNFSSSSWLLDEDSKKFLDTFSADYLDKKKNRITINGHTDATGDPASNMTLSKNRASAVKAYLVKKGVPSEQISINAYGEEKPWAPNNTKEGRKQNRRVMISAE